ncbi:hypothetical protein [Synechococcus sp. CC9616]|uniref:hypothetical protein n=1 Tax=Synechococcus sp. CC9616 TaxID=110663 RepID=UPI00048E50AB|nr:hypothetical protein [Synechococcus sp. CC9616]
MKPKLWIHIGTHKTGTTSIEAFLKTNRTALAHQGIGLLTFPRDARRVLRKHAEGNETAAKRLANTLEDLITKQSRPCTSQLNTYILSWEGFCGNAIKGYNDAPLMANTLNIASKYSNLNPYIILYIRPQEEFISSYYSQIVKDGTTKSIQEFLHGLPSDSFNWLRLTETFEHQFGANQVVVERYCRELFTGKNEILKNFCAHLSINTKDLAFPLSSINSAKNAGWSKPMIEISRRLNAQLSKDEQQTMKEIFNQLTPQIEKNNYTYFTADATTLIKNCYFKSNQELCAKRFPTQTSLFPSHNTNTDRSSHRTSTEILINNITGFNYKPNLDDTLELTLKLVKFIHERQYQSQPIPPSRQHPFTILKRLHIKIKHAFTKVLRTNNSK